MKMRTAVIIGAILLAAVSRTIPHPWNFSPIAAMALFGAALLPSRKLALILPIMAMLFSDLCIEIQYRRGVWPNWGFYWGMWATYAAFFVVTLIGLGLRSLRRVPEVAEGSWVGLLLFALGVVAASLTASIVFFLLTNFYFWASGGLTLAGTPYPRSLGGLLDCYLQALPFFRDTRSGDLIWCACLFGSFTLAEICLPVLKRQATVATVQPAQG
jgi:hypothetical protein